MTPSAPTPVLHPITRLIVGGAQENTMLTAARLDPARFQVEVLSGPQTGSEGSLIEEVRQRGIPLVLLPQLVREINPGKDFVALWKLFRLIRQNRYSIVHTHSSKAGILGRLAAKLAGTPFIVHTVHGWSFHEYMPAPLRHIYILLERWMARFTDKLIAVAQCDIEKGLASGIGAPEKYSLIRSAIPLDEFNPERYARGEVRGALGIPQDALVIGNVGRFSAQKNPLDWVRVAGIVGRARPVTYFLLVGDGPLREDVEIGLKREGIAQRTILTGLRRDAARMMAAMDIFLLTSLWEGLPRVVPQAMAMGVVVVANRADGTSEAIRHGVTGYLCLPGDIESSAGYCIELVDSALKRRSIAVECQRYARKEFDLDAMIHKIDALYENFLESPLD